MPATFEIQEILETESVVPYFQPIVSLKRKQIIGVEGLIRGVHPIDRSLVSPMDLFGRAAQEGRTQALDRLCRKKILEAFRVIHKVDPLMMLTVNFDASVVGGDTEDDDHLLAWAREFGINPANVCVEIIESNVVDLAALRRFVDFHRDHDFLIALDDVGAGHSNLNRIPLLKPDLIKIDRYLVHGIHGDFHKQQVFKSVVNLCRTLGALIIAEGVETGQEALEVMTAGVEMIQGFYFSKPLGVKECLLESQDEKIRHLSSAYKELEIGRIALKRFNLGKYHAMMRELQTALSAVSVEQFDQQLGRMAEYFPNIECFFVIGEDGLQVTETFLNAPIKKNKLLFRAVPKGTDHTMKDYFYMLVEAGLGKLTYITEPYLSQATGTVCVTFASLFRDAAKKRYILCADINIGDFTI